MHFVKAPANGPNVLIVLIDDMGFGQSSAFGGPIHMPTVEALANDGELGVRTGIVQIFNVGSTAAIGAIEFEPGLKQDLPALLRRLIPPSRDYAHEQTWHDGNGHSHLQATLLGPSLAADFSH